MGDLTARSKKDAMVSGSPAPEKFLIETAEDVEKMLSLKKYRTNLPDVSNILEKQKEVGDEGLVCVTSLASPLVMAAHAFKYDFFLVYAFENPEKIREVAEMNFKRMSKLVEYLLDRGAGPVFRYSNFEGYTTPMMPPSFADEFLAPYDEKIIKMIHDGGCYVDNHCHGQLRDQIHNFIRIGSDCINCFEPPPANDIDLREFKQKTDSRISVWGYIQWEDIERKSSDEIRKLTREALEMSGNRGFILSQSASAHASEVSQKFSENIVAMIEEGAAYNREVFSV
jgi:hypothetical protein